MTKLMIALASMAALAACSDSRNRDVARAELPVESLAVAPPDTTAPAREATQPTTSPAKGARRGRAAQRGTPSGPAPVKHRAKRAAAAPAAEPTPARTVDPQSSVGSDGAGSDGAGTDGAAPAPDPIDAQASPTAPDTSTQPTATTDPIGSAALPAGTSIHASLQDSISSRSDSAGDIVMAMVQSDVRNGRGEVVVPAGSPVQLSIASLAPAGAGSGRLALEVDAITIDGRMHRVGGTVQDVPHELRGRGITGNEAAKVGAGTAAGAVIGGVVTGKTRGAVIGGVVGAAGGAVVAARTASRDVVVKSGTPIVVVLTERLAVVP